MGFLLYNQHKWWYKGITVILILALIVMISIGVAPRAKAVVGVATVVVSAVLAAMAAFGIGTIVSGMTSSQIEDYIGGKLEDWAESVGSPLDTLINSSLIGKTASSVFAIGAAAANGIIDFIDWLKTEESITDNSEIEIYSIQGSFAELKIYNGTTINRSELSTQNILFSYQFGNVTNYGVVIYNGPPGSLASAYDTSNHRIVIMPINQQTGSFYIAQTSSNLHESSGTLTLGQDSWRYTNNHYYYDFGGRPTNTDSVTTWYIPTYNNLQEVFAAFDNGIDYGGSLSVDAGTIVDPGIVANEDNLYIDVGAPSVADVAGLADYVLDQVADNQLISDYEIAEAPPVPSVGDINVESYSPGAISQIDQAIQAAIQSALENAGAVEVELVNDTPLSVNTDHHAFGFDLPDITFNFASIWHYVSDAVSYSSSFISWFVSLFTSVPILSIPLYCCFTLVVVLGAFRRFLL